MDLTSTEAVGCSESERIKLQNLTWQLQKRFFSFRISDFSNVSENKLAKTLYEIIIISILLFFTISPL